MTTASPVSGISNAALGRGYFWGGIGLSVAGVALVFVQYSLKVLIVPWYCPALATLGAFLLLCSLARRRTFVRAIALILIAALAGLEWFFLTSLSKLPDYQGRAKAGEKFPAFETTLANGNAFTEKNLQDGTPTVLVFFRGRW